MLVPRRRNNGRNSRRVRLGGHASMLGGQHVYPRIGGLNNGIGLPTNAAFSRSPRPQGFMEILTRLYGVGLELPRDQFNSSWARDPPVRPRRRHRHSEGPGVGLLGEGSITPTLQRNIERRDLLEHLASLLPPPDRRLISHTGLNPLRVDGARPFVPRLPLQPLLPVLPSWIARRPRSPQALMICDDYDAEEEMNELLLMQMLEERCVQDHETQQLIEDVLAIYGICPEDWVDGCPRFRCSACSD
ncbi:hypothetical protein F5884DRAFT_858536 [Xylogone sp. PMI_703]|nr:hypothetical protein F5884DRAFT_858536 [Xylogone sp. PMI_703]